MRGLPLTSPGIHPNGQQTSSQAGRRRAPCPTSSDTPRPHKATGPPDERANGRHNNNRQPNQPGRPAGTTTHPARSAQPIKSPHPARPARPARSTRSARSARPTDRPAQTTGPPRPVPAERSSPAAPGQSNAATVGTVRQGGNTQRPHGRQATTRTGNRAANRQSGDTDREPRGRPTESAIRTKWPRGKLTGCSNARRTGPR